MKKSTPGYKTTEFWMAVSVIASVFGLPVTPDVAASVAGLVASAYAGIRTWLKLGGKK
jgi:hypothetical protein